MKAALISDIKAGMSYKELYAKHDTHSHAVLTIKRAIGLRVGKKLTTDQVNEIKQSSEIRRILAARYGVSVSTVQKIKEGRY